MAVICVMSAKGAPGATTTTLLLASLWPAPSLVLDADPLGGDVGLRLPRSDGRAMDPDRGLLSVLPAARRGLDPVAITQHAQEAVGGQPVIIGLPGPEQAAAAGPMWPTLADLFARVPSIDVFADVGQLQAGSEQLPLVRRSHVLLCVYRPTAWGALHARRRLETMLDLAAEHDVRMGVVAVAAADQERDRLQAAAAIRSGLPGVVDYGAVALDPKAVAMFEGATVYRPERTLLARSGRTLAGRLYDDLAATRPAVDEPVVAEAPARPPRRGRRRAARRLSQDAAT